MMSLRLALRLMNALAFFCKRMTMYLLRKSLEVVKVVSAAYQAAIAMASSSVS